MILEKQNTKKKRLEKFQPSQTMYTYLMNILQNFTQEILGTIFLSIVEDLLWCTFFDNDTAIHKDDTVSYLLGKAHFVGNDRHCHPWFSEVLHNCKNFTNHFWIKGWCRFVKQENVRIHS